MKIKINTWRIVAITVTFIFGLVAWHFFEVNQTVIENNTVLMQEKDSLARKLYKLYAERRTLRSELQVAKKERDQLSGKIEKYQSNAQILENEMGRLKNRLSDLGITKSKKDLEIKELREKVAQYREENIGLRERLVMVVRAQTSGETIKLAPITIETKEGKRVKRRKGKVLEVNRDYDFVIVSMGKKDGIKKDDVLSVFRTGKVLGTILIEKVGNTASVGRALYKPLRDIVKRGDRVIY
ncbi:MAG: hypothetical protein ISS92_05495 [Candidatus Omnitrophica bacterium]|nr:hypothetical protein [Candidatus Omnitrophota bacterium]